MVLYNYGDDGVCVASTIDFYSVSQRYDDDDDYSTERNIFLIESI